MCFFPPTNRVGIVLVILFFILSLILILRDYSEKKSDNAERAAMRNDIQNLKNELAKLQRDPDKEKELSSQFSAGYQLFGVIDKQIVPSAKPSTEEIKIDWTTAKILSVTKDYIKIMTPTTVFSGNNIFYNNTIEIENKEGAIMRVPELGLGGWVSYVKILKSDEKRVVAAIGFMQDTQNNQGNTNRNCRIWNNTVVN
jgi:hypothetical protein